MNISFFVIAASILLIVAAVLLIILAQEDGSGLGKPCTETSGCSSGFICDNGKCKIPVGGSCIDNPTSCVTGTTCVNGVCVPNIIPPIPIPKPDKCQNQKPCSPSPKKCKKPCSPTSPSSSNNDPTNLDTTIQGYGTGTLYYTNNLKSTSHIKLNKNTILGSAYYNERIYFITKSEPTIIKVYNITTKSYEPTISQNLTNITGLESTSDGILYCLVGNTVYFSSIPQALLGTSITWEQINNTVAYQISTPPDRSILHIITDSTQINTVYTDNPNIIMIVYPTTVQVITSGNSETLPRPNGKYPLYINGKIKWTDFFQRYFIDNFNSTYQSIFLYIAS
jgi:hypothetical protein